MPDLHIVEAPPEANPATNPLTEICDYIRRYVIAGEAEILACGLWVLHTYLIESVQITPYLHIFSPEAQSGKTTLRDILGHLAARATSYDYTTAAVLRRSQGEWPPPTILLDEIDALMGQNSDVTESLRGILNAGFRRGATISIMAHNKGSDWSIETISAFGPKVLCGLAALPDTIEGRCIPVRLRKKLKTDETAIFRLVKVEQETDYLKAVIRHWSESVDITDRLDGDGPEMPEELSGRQMDCWSSLFAIADHLGCGKKARQAAIKLHMVAEDESTGVVLLRDIREVFAGKQAMPSAFLTMALTLLADSPWCNAGIGGRSMNAYDLSKMLKPYGIRPERLPREMSPNQERGYTCHQFEDAWLRYCH